MTTQEVFAGAWLAKIAPAAVGAFLAVIEGGQSSNDPISKRLVWSAANFFSAFATGHYLGRAVIEWRGIAEQSATADLVIVFCGFAGLALMRRAREQASLVVDAVINRMANK